MDKGVKAGDIIVKWGPKPSPAKSQAYSMGVVLGAKLLLPEGDWAQQCLTLHNDSAKIIVPHVVGPVLLSPWRVGREWRFLPAGEET